MRIQIISNLESPAHKQALRLYHQRYPSVTWVMEVQNSQDTVKRIQTEKCGIGLCLLSRPVFSLNCQLLFREEFSVYCGAEHPLFGRKEVEKRELRQESLFPLPAPPKAWVSSRWRSSAKASVSGERISGQSPNLEEVRRMIVAGLGIGILPLTAVHDEVASGLLWAARNQGLSARRGRVSGDAPGR